MSDFEPLSHFVGPFKSGETIYVVLISEDKRVALLYDNKSPANVTAEGWRGLHGMACDPDRGLSAVQVQENLHVFFGDEKGVKHSIIDLATLEWVVDESVIGIPDGMHLANCYFDVSGNGDIKVSWSEKCDS